MRTRTKNLITGIFFEIAGTFIFIVAVLHGSQPLGNNTYPTIEVLAMCIMAILFIVFGIYMLELNRIPPQTKVGGFLRVN